jgi:hypothetical protein
MVVEMLLWSLLLYAPMALTGWAVVGQALPFGPEPSFPLVMKLLEAAGPNDGLGPSKVSAAGKI